MGENSHNSKLLREFSAGGAAYKKLKVKSKKSKVLWLIIKPSGTNRWQLPKGTIDKGENSSDTAVREVKEEGGIEAKIIEKIGISQYFFALKGQRIFKTVTYFLMEYLGDTKDGHDHEVDEVIFLPFREAYKRLTFKDDKEILKKAQKMI